MKSPFIKIMSLAITTLFLCEPLSLFAQERGRRGPARANQRTGKRANPPRRAQRRKNIERRSEVRQEKRARKRARQENRPRKERSENFRAESRGRSPEERLLKRERREQARQLREENPEFFNERIAKNRLKKKRIGEHRLKQAELENESRPTERERARRRIAQQRLEQADSERERIATRPQRQQNQFQRFLNRRQERQARRIEHGVTNGYLTEDEAKTLRASQEALAAKEAEYFGDGLLTKGEIKALRNDLKSLSQNIWIQKHNSLGQAANPRVNLHPELSKKFDEDDFTRFEARSLYRNLQDLKEINIELQNPALDKEIRDILQEERSVLFNQYFIYKK